jgi:hypothetical protein
MPDAVNPWTGRWKRVLLRDALIAVLALVVLEAGLRRVDPRYRGHLFDAEFSGGHPIAVNSAGFRGPELPAAKRPGELRLLALGDSTTFGTGVAWEETWPERSGRALAQALGRTVTPINSGVPAASLEDMTFALNGPWGGTRPDDVVLAVSANMVSLGWIRREREAAVPVHVLPSPETTASRGYRLKTSARRLSSRFCLPSFVMLNGERAMYAIGLQDHRIDAEAPYGPMLAHGWRQVGLDPTLAEMAWSRFERDLARLRDAVQARGARFWVTTIPCRFMLTSDWSDNEKFVPRERLSVVPSERVERICAGLGIPTIDAVKALREARSASGGSAPLYRQADYVHLDAEGHRALGEAIALRIAKDR